MSARRVLASALAIALACLPPAQAASRASGPLGPSLPAAVASSGAPRLLPVALISALSNGFSAENAALPQQGAGLPTAPRAHVTAADPWNHYSVPAHVRVEFVGLVPTVRSVPANPRPEFGLAFGAPSPAGPDSARSQNPFSPLSQAAALASQPLPENAGRRFDGGLLGARDRAAQLDPPPPAPLQPAVRPSGLTQGPPERPKKPEGFLKRLNRATRATPGEKQFERGAIWGLLAAALTPVALAMAPTHTLAVSLPLTLSVPVLVFGILTVYRAARYIATRRMPEAARPPPRKFLMLALAAGLAFGGAIGSAPTTMHGPLVEKLAAARSYESVVHVRGGAIESETMSVLSANPIGRQLLESLKDKTGRVRLPTFLVAPQSDASASHIAPFNSVFIGQNEIESMGWTLKDFLADPAKQRLFVRRFQATIAHELTHAMQARRSIFEPGQWSLSMEHEYEAFLIQHFYRHEMLRAGAPEFDDQLWQYEQLLENLEEFLTSLDGDYKNKHMRIPSYEQFIAGVRRSWREHQIEGYELLARHKAGDPFLAKKFQAKADALRKS